MTALVPVIETPRLTLRALSRRGGGAEAAWFARPASAREGEPGPRGAVRRVIAAMVGHRTFRGMGLRAVGRRDGGACRGRMGVRDPEVRPEPELGRTVADAAVAPPGATHPQGGRA